MTQKTKAHQSPPPDRRPGRVIIRIKGINDSEVIAVIPGWNPHEAVSIPLRLVPAELLRGLGEGDYFIGNVNIGAHTPEDLFFENFEPAPKPAEI